MPTLLPAGRPVFDVELLRELRGRVLVQQLRVLCVLGAHRFDELPLVNWLFPGLRHIYLFEPLAEPLAVLHDLAARDGRIRVFPCAVAAEDGTARFHVTSNDGQSSSLLALGSHRELFPEVTVNRTIEVPTRRLNSVLAEHRLPPPDLMLIDVQGAEFLVLKSMPPSVLDGVRLIYSEVSTEAVYQSAGLLADVEALLSPRFVNLGFAALRPETPVHGNALFVARADVPAALALTRHERLRQVFHRFKRRVRAAAAAQ